MGDKGGMRTRAERSLGSRWTGFAALTAAVLLASALSPAHACAFAPGEPLATPFPRLSVWWPDESEQTPADLARYDWLCLGPWAPSTLARIRSHNPDVLLLASTNACEVDFDPGLPASHPQNAAVAKLPARWLLTQVGGTLTQAITASTTRFTVSSVSSAAPGGGTIALFKPGDPVVIEDEIALVTAVDAPARTLTVRRGVVKPAAGHAAGTRIAATISFWPKSLMMDVTSACPRITVDAKAGPESWAAYNARTGAALAADAAWDGLMVDRADSSESWIVGRSTARSIDPDRSNTLPADGYAAFDEAWGLGVLGYELRLRAALGEEKLMVSNWGAPNYPVLNGNNFEGFPNADAEGYPWRSLVVGPAEQDGSYFEWLAFARQPNLTTIQTYEDDSGAPPTGDGGYDNPADRPGFVPTYRKMRYGLATALMGDGFFSYEINTNGQAGLGLLWFDEFDGAGRGRGWLGEPLAPSYPVWRPLPAPELIGAAGSFESDAHLGEWAEEVVSGAATFARDTSSPGAGASSLRVTVTSPAAEEWHVNVSHPLAVAKGSEYTLTFRARADTAHAVTAWIQRSGAPYDSLAWLGGVDLTPEWRTYTLSGTVADSASRAQLFLALGDSTGSVWIDDVQVRKGNPDVWRRDFTGGTAIVNATGSAVTVPLGGYYRKLFGTQVPSVNDGRLVDSVTVGPRDGVLLATTAETTRPDYVPVYRFYNRTNGSHFYTASSAEKNAVIANLSGTYSLDGVAYWVNTNDPANKDPLYRFFNRTNGSHFYTASPAEKNAVIANLSGTYTYDGPAYNISAATRSSRYLSVYRFYNRKNGSHFYTASAAEKNTVLSTLSGTYTLDGVAFQVAP